MQETSEHYLKVLRERFPQSQEVVKDVAMFLSGKGFLVSLLPWQLAETTEQLRDCADSGDLYIGYRAEVKQRHNQLYPQDGMVYFRSKYNNNWILSRSPEIFILGEKKMKQHPEPVRVFVLDSTGRQGYVCDIPKIKKHWRLVNNVVDHAHQRRAGYYVCDVKYLTYFDMDADE